MRSAVSVVFWLAAIANDGLEPRGEPVTGNRHVIAMEEGIGRAWLWPQGFGPSPLRTEVGGMPRMLHGTAMPMWAYG